MIIPARCALGKEWARRMQRTRSLTSTSIAAVSAALLTSLCTFLFSCLSYTHTCKHTSKPLSLWLRERIYLHKEKRAAPQRCPWHLPPRTACPFISVDRFSTRDELQSDSSRTSKSLSWMSADLSHVTPFFLPCANNLPGVHESCSFLHFRGISRSPEFQRGNKMIMQKKNFFENKQIKINAFTQPLWQAPVWVCISLHRRGPRLPLHCCHFPCSAPRFHLPFPPLSPSSLHLTGPFTQHLCFSVLHLWSGMICAACKQGSVKQGNTLPPALVSGRLGS